MKTTQTHSDSLPSIFIRTLIYTLAAVLFFKGYSEFAGKLGAILGVVLAIFLAHLMARAQLRLLAFWGILLTISISSYYGQGLIANSTTIANLLGTFSSLQMAQGFNIALSCFGICFILRSLALRFQWVGIFEMLTISGVVVLTLMAHRDNHLSEPQFLSDWVWKRGGNLTNTLMWIGALTFLGGSLILLERQRLRKSVFSILLIGLIALGSYTYLEKYPYEPPPARGLLSSQGDPASENKVEADLPGDSVGKDGRKQGNTAGQGNQNPQNGPSGQPQQNSNSTGGQGSANPNPQNGTPQNGNPQNQQQGNSSNQPKLDFNPPPSSGNSRSMPAAVVVFHDDYSSPNGYYYFRQTAFSQYNGNRLVRSTVKGTDSDLIEDENLGQATAIADAPFPTFKFFNLVGLSFIVPPESLPPLPNSDHPTENSKSFTELRTTVAWVSDQKSLFGLVQPKKYISVRNPNPQQFRRAYEVVSDALLLTYEQMLNYKAGDPNWTPELWKHYLEIPNDQRYEQLAQEIVSKLNPTYRHSPIAQAMMIRMWLEKNATYSLKEHHPDEQDPVASFLFGNRKGYCVQLSHSLAYLLRSIGVPTRVSAGYAAPVSRRGLGSNLLIQQQDAHAWAEIYLDGLGWVAMDVGPEKVEEENKPEVNESLQQTIGEMARGDHSAGKMEEPPKPDEPSKFLSYTYSIFKWTFLLGLPLLILSFYLIKGWRRLAPQFAKENKLYRVSYRRGLDLLAEAGWRRDFGQSREHFTESLSQGFPALVKMTAAHLAQAMGKQTQKRLSRQEWLELDRELIQSIRTHSKPWRRILGKLNPFSWILVK